MDKSLIIPFTIQSNPGVYAILLGSGVSKAAGISTGWDITLDLCKKYASVNGESPEDPYNWYVEKFNDEPRYDDLLAAITNTTAERQALLRKYFEPTEEEREQGLKVPTSTHRSIAKLVKDGYIRMILTTNFDRLMEMALEEEGIQYDVASNEDSLNGIRPYVHSKCTIIKLHGDYKDTRIKNTSEELSEYPKILDNLLDRIFDEFGLITVGWSGVWDGALRSAMLRCRTRRYSWFWLTISEPSNEAREIINHRLANVIMIPNADSFFNALPLKISAIDNLEKIHPLNQEICRELTKKLILKGNLIELYDLVHSETLRIAEYIKGAPVSGDPIDYEDEVKRYYIKSENLLVIIATITLFYFNDPHQRSNKYLELLKKTFERIHFKEIVGGKESFTNLKNYPLLLAIYTLGISAIIGNRDVLKSIFIEINSEDEHGRHILKHKYPGRVLSGSLSRPIEREVTPRNNHIFEEMKNIFVPSILTDKEYEEAFDAFEFLYGIIYLYKFSSWSPVGRFIWRRGGEETIKNLLKKRNGQWPFIEMFENEDLFKQTLNIYQQHINRAAIQSYSGNEFPLSDWFNS